MAYRMLLEGTRLAPTSDDVCGYSGEVEDVADVLDDVHLDRGFCRLELGHVLRRECSPP